MSRLREELRVIPRPGLVIAFVAAATLATLVMVLVEDDLGIRLAIASAGALIFIVYISLVSYVYGDARRRGMRHVLWTLVVTFVPQALGFIVYFLVRDPLLTPCASCGTLARRDFAFCPQCGSTLPRVCPSCSRPVEPVWPHCAHCGARLLDVKPALEGAPANASEHTQGSA